MITLQDCTAMARKALAWDDSIWAQVRTFDRTDAEGEWLVCEAFTTRAPLSNPVERDKLERREVKARFKRRPGLHADIALHEMTLRLYGELYALLEHEMNSKGNDR